jgi:hypothetical protein
MATPPNPPQVVKLPENVNQPATHGASSTESGWVPTKAKPEYIDLPQGKELKDSSALDLAKSRPVQWIVLAGPSGSGKTTLLTSLYELFQWRRVEGYAFAGSITLPAFEERCYLSRRESGNDEAHTQRTPFADVNPLYLHLRIRSTEGLRPFSDFLCTDVSGETFEHARDSTTECKKMSFIRRAHHFLLLLDSGKGVQRDKRWAMVEDNRALLRSCVDSDMIAANCEVSVVWSRWDYFVAAEDEKRNQPFRAEVEQQFRETFDKLIPNLKFCEVAARPLKAPTLGIGYGVSALLKQWATAPLEMKALDLFPKSYSGTRESELFAARHFALTSANEESDR